MRPATAARAGVGGGVTRPTAPVSRLGRFIPSGTALFVMVMCLAIAVVTKVIAVSLGEGGGLYIAGGVAVLLTPAAFAWRERALRPLGPEVLLPAAFYLSMYHAPIRRLFAGRALTFLEIEVLEMALAASLSVAWAVSLRPGAFDPSRALPPPVPDATARRARLEAYAGIGAALIGFVLFVVWVGSVGVDRLLAADYGEVYQYAGEQTTVTFQWPFIVGGIVTVSRAFARWPGAGPSFRLRAVQYALIGLFIAATARLGVRGPTLELIAGVFLVRYETARPIARRALIAVGVGFATLFFFVSAMRGNLSSGVAGTSADDVAKQAEESVSGQSATEFDAIFDNHVMMVGLAGKKLPLLEGKSYADIPLQMVPRQIVGEKPVALSAWWIQYVDPESARRGGGRAFGSFTEGYLNFALPGAVGQVCAVTVILLLVFPYLRRDAIGLAPAVATTLAHAYHCHRIEMIGVLFFLRNALIVTAATLAIAWLLRTLVLPTRDGAAVIVGGERGRPKSDAAEGTSPSHA